MSLKYPFLTPASHILFCVYLACCLYYNKGFQELFSRHVWECLFVFRLVRLIAATGLCGRDVGWGCHRLIAAAGLCGRDVGWGCDRLTAAAGLCGMDVGWGCDQSHQTPKKTSCIYYWQDRSRSVHSLGVTLYFLSVQTA